MPLRLTITKLMNISSGILSNDNHKINEKFSFVVSDSDVVNYFEGEIVYKTGPEEFDYTLIKNKDNTETIIVMSEGKIPNPWKGSNTLIMIPGKTNEAIDALTIKTVDSSSPNTIDPVSGWNYNTWNIISPITIENHTIEKVEIVSLAKISDTHYSARAKIHIVNNETGELFGPDYVVSRSGYLLLSRGLNKEGPQEFNLMSGYEMQDAAVILHKIEAI